MSGYQISPVSIEGKGRPIIRSVVRLALLALGGNAGIFCRGNDPLPITSPETTISTRRFSLRPAAGCYPPRDLPFVTPRRYVIYVHSRTNQIVAHDSARFSESVLYSSLPMASV